MSGWLPPSLRRWWDRRQLREARWAPLFEPASGAEVVSLDMETTSLDVATAEVLSIAAVPVDAGGVRLSERFVRLVRSERDFGIESIRVHRILPGESAIAGSLDTALDELLTWLGPRPILGYYVAFDAGVLSRLSRARHGFDLPQRRVELATVFEAARRHRHAGREPDLRLESIAADLGIPLMGRHTALGDAVSVGLCYAALLRERGRG